MNDALVGRDAELALIDDARRRGVPAIVIGGAAGVGKTRLVNEVEGRATSDGWRIERVLATASAREIPLGACAGLWQASGRESSEAAASRVVSEVRARATGPTLLVVDDAHLLDASSAQVVAVLARDENIMCVVTTRTGEAVHDSVRGLWKDAGGERVELQTLSLDETVALASELLGGPIEHATGRRLFVQCGGNAMFLRELVGALRRSDALDEQFGVWRWTGAGAVSARLEEIVDARIDQLEPGDLRALEYVAFGEPLELGIVQALDVSDGVAGLERAGLVHVHPDGQRLMIRLSHPLFGETVRERVGKVQARQLHASLLAALSGLGARRRDDAFRLAVWQLRAGIAREPQSLIVAAREARSRGDFDLMERLADAATAAGGGLEARALAAHALKDRGDDQAALDALRALVTEDGPDAVRADIAEALAAHLAIGLGQVDAARAVLDDALASVRDSAARAVLEALQVALHPHSSGPDLITPSSANAANEGDGDGGDDTTRLLTWLGTAHADLVAGRFAAVEALSDEMWERALRLRERRPEGVFWVAVLRWHALVHLARLDDADALAQDALVQAADHPYARVRAWFIDMLGTGALVRGDAATAVRYLEEAVAVRRADDRGSLAGSLLALTCARALLGHVAAAQAALTEAATNPVSVLAPLVEAPRAEAALLAAKGRIPSARKVMVAYARACHANSLYLYELWAWNDAARYGAVSEAAAGLDALIEHVDAPLPGVFAAAARALASRDPSTLVAAGHRLRDLGLNIDAAEILATAARLAEAERDHRLAQRCTADVETLRQRLAGVDTPALRNRPIVAALSERELEVATLAAEGQRDTDIAAALIVSIRTVHAHLRSVYTKLGIAGRSEIAAALEQRAGELNR